MRVIRVQIATDKLDRYELENAVIGALAGGDFSPYSVYTGIAVFEGSQESEATVTLHEANTADAVLAWRAMRLAIPGVDCGRIWDRGKSWCAKSYENQYVRDLMENEECFVPWPNDDYRPTEV